MKVKYSIPENAEVISSIGVALSMVRDVVERIIPSPTKDDISEIKNEAMDKAIESGATEESVEVHIEIDSQTSKVTAIATGSTEVKTTDLLKECTEKEARTIAADDMRIEEKDTELMCQTPHFYVFGEKSKVDEEKPSPVRILDKKGFIKIQRGYSKAVKTTVDASEDTMKSLWEDMAVYQSEVILRPDIYICAGARVMDFTVTEFEQLKLLTGIELAAFSQDEEIVIVAGNIRQD